MENIIKKYINALHDLNVNEKILNDIINVILQTKGNVIFTGVGKSSHIAHKACSTFSSTGTPSIFIHPTEASHGDLGSIQNNDIVLVISKSGKSKELYDIINYCNNYNICLISLTEDEKSFLGSNSNYCLKLPKTIEACPNNLAPTISTTISMIMCDIISIKVSKNKKFSENDFKKYHPGGNLGKELLSVSKLMTKNLPLVNDKSTIYNAILEMTNKRMGCVGISNENNEIIGIITDGDLRRNINIDLNNNVNEIMTKNFKTIDKNILCKNALETMNQESITNLFVTDKETVVGIIHIHDII